MRCSSEPATAQLSASAAAEAAGGYDVDALVDDINAAKQERNADVSLYARARIAALVRAQRRWHAVRDDLRAAQFRKQAVDFAGCGLMALPAFGPVYPLAAGIGERDEGPEPVFCLLRQHRRLPSPLVTGDGEGRKARGR